MATATTPAAPIQLSPRELQFLTTSKQVGMTGLLLLRRMKHLGTIFTTSERNLADHSLCSVATVKRYMNKLKGLGMVEVFNQGRSPGGTWLPNKYRLLAPAFDYLAHFQHPPWLNSAPQVKESEKKTCKSMVSYGEKTEIIGGRPYTFMFKTTSPPLYESPAHTSRFAF
jgi:hypothetical protein